MAFDVSKLTLGEIAKVEELSGFGIGLIEDPATPKGKLFVALAYVIQKRIDPTYTLAKAEGLTLIEAEAIVTGGDAVVDAPAPYQAPPSQLGVEQPQLYAPAPFPTQPAPFPTQPAPAAGQN